MKCTRCGEHRAYSEAELATGKPPDLPYPPGICIGCVLKDPTLHAPIQAWLDKQITGAATALRDQAGAALDAADALVGRLGL